MVSEKTGLKTEPEKPEKVCMPFESREHEMFYYEKSKKSGQCDCYHQALFYLLGISGVTRKHFRQIYNVNSGCINPECLNYAWQTGGSRKIVRLAFNLYTDRIPDERERGEGELDEYRQYSVSSIFRCGYARYFWEGIRLRYPEYVAVGCY